MGYVNSALGINVGNEVKIRKGEFKGKKCRISRIYRGRGRRKYSFECFVFDPFFKKRKLQRYTKGEIKKV